MAKPEESRLSHDFIELYRSYKRKTKKVLSWLRETCQLQDVSVAGLVAAAKSVRKQKIEVPTELYYVLKDAIALRVEIAQQYKQQLLVNGADDAKNKAIETHEYFISR